MTTFECNNGHRFNTPKFGRPLEADGAQEWMCPACSVTYFHVVELGGDPNSLEDSCDGACTL